MTKAKSKAPEMGWFGWFRSVGGRIAPAVIYDFMAKGEKDRVVYMVSLPNEELGLSLERLVAKYPAPVEAAA